MRAHVSIQSTFAVVFVLTLLTPTNSSAVEYSAQPSISLQEVRDDNVLLSTQPHESVTSSVLSPQLDVAASMESWQIKATGRLRSVRYSRNAGLDTNDKFLTFSSTLNQERNLWQLSGLTSKESTLLSETFNPDLSIARTQTHRTTRSLGPSWTALLTEATQLKLDYQSSDISYDKVPNTPFSDYQTDQANLTLSNQLSARTQIFVIGSYSAFNVPVADYTSKTNSWQLGLTRDFSETVKVTLSAGGRRTTSERVVSCIFNLVPCPLIFTINRIDITKDSGSVYNLNVQKQLERTRIDLTVKRSTDPSGSATLIQTSSISAGVSHEISQTRLTASLNASGYHSKAVDGNTAIYPEQDYYLLETRLDWRWTERWSLGGSYRRVRLKYMNNDASPTSNAVQITLSYQAPRFAISR